MFSCPLPLLMFSSLGFVSSGISTQKGDVFLPNDGASLVPTRPPLCGTFSPTRPSRSLFGAFPAAAAPAGLSFERDDILWASGTTRKDDDDFVVSDCSGDRSGSRSGSCLSERE